MSAAGICGRDDGPEWDFELGDAVRVSLNGRIVGRSEFETGGDSYLVEYERRGKTFREWVLADKLEADDAVVTIGGAA